ncbi:hypothetical protein BDN72DRAFT_633251 [Pluteus cervinus]|uniref:Uncharacterized protein n=1 Tax=Pluteus cervinus TaxID=181527 RepID=A0ACD3B9M6_9AGAR|nr:hypothetical protein BDN72DRAFT_633251 [Pluteus cervinus]
MNPTDSWCFRRQLSPKNLVLNFFKASLHQFIATFSAFLYHIPLVGVLSSRLAWDYHVYCFLIFLKSVGSTHPTRWIDDTFCNWAFDRFALSPH